MLYYLLRGCILFITVVLARQRWLKKGTLKNRVDCHDTETLGDGAARRSIAQDEAQDDNGKWSSNDIVCRIDGRGGLISSLVFLDGGKHIAGSCHDDNKVRVWKMEPNSRPEETEPSGIEHGIGIAINAIAASKDGKYIVSGDNHGKVMIWNVAMYPSRKVGELTGEGKIEALDISPDSLRVACGSEDGAVVVWCIDKKERRVGPLKHQGSESPVSSVKFSPTGSRIASAYHVVGQDNCSIRIWHSRSGALLESLPIVQSTYSIAWSGDGQRLFAGGPSGSVKCFDVVTRSLLLEWEVPFGDLITSLCVTRNGQHLVSVSSGRTKQMDVWDILKKPPGKTLPSCNGVSIASVSRDGACLAGVKGSGIDIRNLSTVIDRFHLFHRLSPLTGQFEPFTYISNTVYEAWRSGKLATAEEVLSKEIEDHCYQDLIRYERANRALVRVRRRNWTGALEDADAATHVDGQTPLVAYVAKGLALNGQGNIDEAMSVFGSTLCGCDDDTKHFVECVKSIAFLNVERINGVYCEPDIPFDSSLYRLVRARRHFLLACRHMNGKDYKNVLESLKSVPDLGPLLHLPGARTLSLIFDWDLHGLISDIHELRCRALFESGHILGVPNYFSAKGEDLSEELETIRAELSSISEGFGDQARRQRRHNEAIAWYTEALVLAGCPSDIVGRGGIGTPQIKIDVAVDPEKDKAIAQCLASLPRCPQCLAHLLAKRSEGEAEMKSWTSALTDAKWAIGSDPLYPLGYQNKYIALHGMKCYEKAFVALTDMFQRFESFNDTEICKLHKNYSETLMEIDNIIKAIFDASPFVLIHGKDGRLCNQKERRRRFKEDPIFYELVSSMSTAPDPVNIKAMVEHYFLYVMLSHTWDEREPSFDDVSGHSVYVLGNEKLRNFCETVRDDYKPYQWSWSDTCCIDKRDRDVYQKSIRSMYKWYNNSALTLILLAHPSKSNPHSSRYLEHNRWMFRAWTLQELLAPQVIRFYDHTWKLYLDDNNTNHKTSPKIKPELARATGVDEDALIHFDPEKLPVRQRLRLASTREATVKVDIAYSLIGIFSSDIHVEYTREAEDALGLLLQEIVNRRGDVTVLDWVGKPSKFNSSIPADISVYSQAPYVLPSIADAELDQRVGVLRGTLPEREVARFYDHLTTLGLPRFADRRLSLPCITFSVIDIEPDTLSGATEQSAPTYLASTEALGKFKFKTEDTSFSELRQGRVVLAYPWIHDLLARIHHLGGDEHTQALRLIAHLEHGFKALLFRKQSHQQYRRVAADEEITVPTCELTSLRDIGVKVLEIWETL